MKEALKLALEALETLHDENMDYLVRNKLGGENNQCMVFARDVIKSIKRTLAQQNDHSEQHLDMVKAQPEQEPVATVESVATVVSESGNQEVTMSWWHEPALPVGTKLYTAPPQRTWVGLTDEEHITLHDKFVDTDCYGLLIDAVEAKLKEKNT